MPVTLNEQVADSTSYSNVKSLADMAATAQNLATQNSVSNQQRIDAISAAHLESALAMNQALTARATRFILDLSAEQSQAFNAEMSANLNSKLSDIATNMQAIKAGQSTPPQTGTGGAFGSDSGSALSQQLANLQALMSDMAARLAVIKTA